MKRYKVINKNKMRFGMIGKLFASHPVDKKNLIALEFESGNIDHFEEKDLKEVKGKK